MFILARALKNVGIRNVYGLVGIPITEAAYLVQEQGIRFVGFRFEQQAGMAVTLSSLGFLNGLTATANATVNCYPMIQISGASDPTMVDMKMGTYEELDQLNTARPLERAAPAVSCQRHSVGCQPRLSRRCQRTPGWSLHRYDNSGSRRGHGCG